MYRTQPAVRDRIGAALLTAAVAVLVGWALVAGLRLARAPAEGEALVTFDVAPPPPPPPHRIVPERTRSRRPRGEAAPPNLRSDPTPVVAPPPIIPLPVPPPVVTAPVAGEAADPSAGAAPRPGPGTGAGGIGQGRGSGGAGDGDGGDDWADETPPRRIRGRLTYGDGERVVGEAVIGRSVSVRYHVEVNGRATGCRVTRSSGLALLDAEVCRLIERRFRYDPSRDAAGRPVRSVMVVDHDWDEER